MKTVVFRFYANLNDFLPPRRRGSNVEHAFEGRVSVKDVIEALGVPHTEVDLLLANGDPVDFSYLVRDHDRIAVYPHFASLDVRPISLVLPAPLVELRFVADGHLGRLASLLRLLGFDTHYQSNTRDKDLARISAEEERILLTRDRGLLKRRVVTHAYLVRETDPREQLKEVIVRFSLIGLARPFRRCLRCNSLLEPASLDQAWDVIPPLTRRFYQEFWRCPGCGRIYWKGSHYRAMSAYLDSLRGCGSSLEEQG